jgi:hypothetical protein
VCGGQTPLIAPPTMILHLDTTILDDRDTMILLERMQGYRKTKSNIMIISK